MSVENDAEMAGSASKVHGKLYRNIMFPLLFTFEFHSYMKGVFSAGSDDDDHVDLTSVDDQPAA
jgi:hypothetical protein